MNNTNLEVVVFPQLNKQAQRKIRSNKHSLFIFGGPCQLSKFKQLSGDLIKNSLLV